MINYLKHFKVQIRGDKITLPQAQYVSPVVYFILILVTLIGFIHTLIIFFIHSYSKETARARRSGLQSTFQLPENEVIDYKNIIKRNIFNVDGTIPDTNIEEGQFCSGETKKSSLSIKVLGIIYGGNSKNSIALLEKNGDGKNLVFRVGETVLAGVKISDISKDRVFITGNSCPEFLELNYPQVQQKRGPTDKKKSNAVVFEDGFERVGNTTTVTKQWVADIINTKLSSVLEQARAVPYLVGGQVKGFLINQIIPNSVYAKLGLKNGDVVISINGIELNDAARAIQTLNSLRNENKIDLDILRDGQSVNLKVNIQ